MRITNFILLTAVLFSACDKKPVEKEDKMQQIMGLKNMSNLATAEYVVTKIIKASDNKTWYKVGDRKILMSCKATIVAGIDLSQFSPQDVQINGEDITLRLPHAQLLYVNIKPEDIKTAYEEVSFFRTRFSGAEKDALSAQAQKQIKNEAREMGVLLTAETNAAIFIDHFLKNLGYRNINITYDAMPNKIVNE